MSRDEIEAWLRRVYAVRAAGDVASAMAMMGPDTTYRMAGDAGTSPIPAVAQRGAALGAMLEAMCAAMPARSLELARVIVDGDTAAVEVRARLVFAPTGEEFDTSWVGLWTFRNGKPVEAVEYIDTARFAQLQASAG